MYWLINSGRIDFHKIGALLTFPICLILLFTVLSGVVINNYRWVLLLRGQNFDISTRETLPLTFIGLFFNFAMPGGVGGDVVKGYYLVNDHKERKVAAGMSVLVDRLVGFFVMTFMGLAALAFDFENILKRPQMVVLLLIILGFFLGFVVFFGLAFSKSVNAHPWTESPFRKLPGGKLFRKLYEAVHSYSEHRPNFYWACLLSVFSQSFAILFFMIAGGHVSPVSLPWQTYAVVVQVGLIAASIQISPAGVGVSQAAFDFLFEVNNGVAVKGLGSNLATGNQVMMFILGLVGGYFFFVRKKKTGNSAIGT